MVANVSGLVAKHLGDPGIILGIIISYSVRRHHQLVQHCSMLKCICSVVDHQQNGIGHLDVHLDYIGVHLRTSIRILAECLVFSRIRVFAVMFHDL